MGDIHKSSIYIKNNVHNKLLNNTTIIIDKTCIVKRKKGINKGMANNEELFDFGFTLVDEDELDIVQEVKAEVESVVSNKETTTKRLDNLYNAIQPLLNNLKQNPEKEYIKWPNRLEKIEQFEGVIQKIYKGE